MSTDSGESHPSAEDVLSVMDSFIEHIHRIRKLLLGVSLSAIILAPLAIGLSIYLMFHPSFFAILEIENEFGVILSVLLGAVIIISVIWLATGIRQYRSMSHWKERYDSYTKGKEEMDKKIASQFGLDQE